MRRQYAVVFFAFVALLGSIVALFGTLRDRAYLLRGYADATQDANLPFLVPRLGVNAELTRYDDEQLASQLDLMEAAHVNWVRQLFQWDLIEPLNGEFDWRETDRVLNALGEHPQLRLIAVLVNSPIWARNPQSPEQATAPPNDPRRFADFARAFAERYGHQVDYYQIWDEQNLITGWGGLDPQPADYVALLQEAYTAIHGADETATVIAGGLSPTVETGPQNISDILYLHLMYQLGAKDFMDGVAAKPHGFALPPDDRTVDNDTLNFSRIIALREEMVRNGDGKKALWASNWGWNHLADGWKGKPSIWGQVTGQQQITYTLAALERAEREWPWLAAMTLQHWQPDAAPDDPIWGFALIGRKGNPSALWDALSQRPSLEVVPNGLFTVTNPYVHYHGVWTFSRLGADIGWLRDSQLDFDFRGTDVAMLLRRDKYVAYLYLTIDGKPANATAHDADGNAYVVLTSATLDPELSLVPIARGLVSGLHRLHVTADRGWDHWALAGFAVSDGDAAAPVNRQIGVALVALFFSAASTIASAWQVDWQTLLSPVPRFWTGVSATGQLIIGAITSVALAIGMLLTWGDGTPAFLRKESVQVALSILSAGLIYLEPGLIITVAAGVTLFIVIYNRLEIGLLLTIFWAPFFLFPVELFLFSFPMVEIVILLATTAWALKMGARWGRNRQNARLGQVPGRSSAKRIRRILTLDWVILAWTLLGLLSLTWAAHLPEAITELRAMIVEPALFYLILRTVQPDRKLVFSLVATLLLAGLLVALIGLINYLNPALRITAEGGAQRLTSVYGSPNNVGLFLGRCIPFALAFLVIRSDRTSRVAAGITLLILIIAVILSQSAGALFLGIPAAILTVVLCVWRKRAPLISVLFIAFTIVAFVVALQFPRFSRIFDTNEGTTFFRLRLWQSTLEMIGDHPITGVGLDQFLYAYRSEYIRPDAEAQRDLSHPHNILLDFWVRLGLGGVLLLLWTQIVFWRTSWANYRHSLLRDPLLLTLVVGAMGSMADLLAHGLIDNSVYVIDLAYVFVFLLALVAIVQNIGAIDEGNSKMV